MKQEDLDDIRRYAEAAQGEGQQGVADVPLMYSATRARLAGRLSPEVVLELLGGASVSAASPMSAADMEALRERLQDQAEQWTSRAETAAPEAAEVLNECADELMAVLTAPAG